MTTVDFWEDSQWYFADDLDHAVKVREQWGTELGSCPHFYEEANDAWFVRYPDGLFCD